MSLQLFDIRENEAGIAQAWLMGTMGNRPAQRRAAKKDLLRFPIPETCHKVTEIATNTMSLRVTSNLLYGLSLIYKQQVSYMATDLSCVYDRMASQWIRLDGGSTEAPPLKRRTHVSLLVDDPQFDIETDFAPLPLKGPSKLDERASMIRAFDRHLNGLEEHLQNPDVVEADERDRSFDDYINRTANTTRISIDEDYMVDFEFGPDGNIVGENNLLSGQDLLTHLNTEEDYTTLGATADDLTKGDSSGTNDKHFSLIEGAHQEAASGMDDGQAEPTNRKRRKLKLIHDEVTTISLREIDQSTPTHVFQHRENTLKGLYAEVFAKQHRYLSLQYQHIFGPTVGRISRPLSRPQSIQTYLSEEVNGIEFGRDRPRRRSSTDFVPDLEADRRGPVEQLHQDFMFDIEPVIPEIRMEEDDWASTTAHEEAMSKLREFKVFLTERARNLRQNVNSESKYSFEELIPSRSAPDEMPVTKKLAANSFALLLELTKDASIEIADDKAEHCLSYSTQIFITIK